MGVTVFFGGTFNPLHIGHYEIVTALCEREEIDKVYIMPDRIPPHKSDAFLAPDEDRIEMCRLAAKAHEKAEVLTVEFEREGKSYTFDTVCELERRYPDTRFCMACGGDMVATLDRWYRGEELIRKIPFYGFKRAGEADFDAHVQRLREKGAQITVLDKEITEVSSTALRELLANGGTTKLLPPEIYEYIIKRGLYK